MQFPNVSFKSHKWHPGSVVLADSVEWDHCQVGESQNGGLSALIFSALSSLRNRFYHQHSTFSTWEPSHPSQHLGSWLWNLAVKSLVHYLLTCMSLQALIISHFCPFRGFLWAVWSLAMKQCYSLRASAGPWVFVIGLQCDKHRNWVLRNFYRNLTLMWHSST